jgi:glucokinase
MERTLPRLQHNRRLATEGLVAGVDIGGTNQTVALARLDGEVLATRRHRLPPGGTAGDVIAAVLAMLDGALESVPPTAGRPGAEKLLRIGVGFGGPVDIEAGTVLTSHHVSGWDGFPLRRTLESCRNAATVIDNDANAAALGEAHFGAGRGHRNVLYLNVGTGIGAGLILNGRLFHGQHGMAGEIGHVTVVPDPADAPEGPDLPGSPGPPWAGRDAPPCPCGKRGCLEAVASGRAIGQRARAAAAADPVGAAGLLALAGGETAQIEGPHVLAAAGAGDPLAVRLVAETAAYLGLALGNAANIVDPSVIVVGGGVGEAGEVLFAPLRAAVRRHLLPSMPPPEVVPAALGYDAGIAGALALALEGI